MHEEYYAKNIEGKNKIESESDLKALDNVLNYFEISQKNGFDEALNIIDRNFKYKRINSAYVEKLQILHLHAKKILAHYVRLRKKAHQFKPEFLEKVCLLSYALGVYYFDKEYNIRFAKKYLRISNELAEELDLDKNNRRNIYRQLFKVFLYSASGSEKKYKPGRFREAKKYFDEYEKCISDKNFVYYCDLFRFHTKFVKYFMNNFVNNMGSIEKHVHLPAPIDTGSYKVKAIEYLKEIEKLAVTESDKGLINHCYGLYYSMLARMCKRGSLDEKKNNYEKAMEYYKKSLTHKSKDNYELARSLKNIALVSYELARIDNLHKDKYINNAIDYYREYFSKRISFINIMYGVQIVDNLFNFSKILLEKNDFDVAIKCCLITDHVLKNLDRKKIEKNYKKTLFAIWNICRLLRNLSRISLY